MPYPSTIGGALMGYPSTVDTGQTIPWALLPDDHETWSTNTTGLSTNNTYIVATTLTANVTLTAFRFRCIAGGNGNYDAGIYDSSGNRLAHSGSTATSSATITATLATALLLSPGRYYLALWVDNATDTFRATSVSNGLSLSSFASTGAGGLQTSISPPLGSLGLAIDIIGLLSGGWS